MMKVFIIFVVLSTTTTALPLSQGVTLAWHSSSSLEVTFEDGETDLINLTPARINGHDPCLFTGELASGKDATISVSGCKDSSDETIVTLTYGEVLALLSLKDGITSEIEQDPKVKVDDLDPPNMDGDMHRVRAMEADIPSPDVLNVSTKIIYDRDLLDQFRGDHAKVDDWLDDIILLVRPLLMHASLKTKFHVNIIGEYEFEDVRIQEADTQSVIRLMPLVRKHGILIGAFTHDTCDGRCRKGAAWLGSACDASRGYAVSINELWGEPSSPREKMSTAITYAHEFGHNMGMSHDFGERNGGSGFPGVPPISECEGKGIMSYGDHPKSWSECSNRNHEEAWRSGVEGRPALSTCLSGSTGKPTVNPPAESGSIKSPNYPNNYNARVNEVFGLEVASGSRVELVFEDFVLENEPGCNYDYVEVFDTDNTSLIKACGTDKPGKITSSGNKMTIKFKSDYSVQKRGFKANWKAV